MTCQSLEVWKFVGRPMTKEENREDYWDIEQLDHRSEEAAVIPEDGGE